MSSVEPTAREVLRSRRVRASLRDRAPVSCQFRRLFGRTTYTMIGSCAAGACVIALPDGTYQATYVTHEYAAQYTRWLGRVRDRLRAPRRFFDTTIELLTAIPVPDDGVCAVTVPGRDVQVGIDGLIDYVLRRRQHGAPS